MSKKRNSSEPGKAEPSEPPYAPSFPIVGIGASAGGLEAFRGLLSALPNGTGMAYVLVQHLDRNHESILAELLSEATSMQVTEVKVDTLVEPNRVYVIPPSQDLIFAAGMLKLVPRAQMGLAHMPIDSFLKTLADQQGSRAIGVILSGMGSDGTLGLRAIDAEGGIAFAQEPMSAKHADMPRSALAGGCVDFVLPPEAIALELARLGKHPYLEGRDPAPPEAPIATTEVPADDQHELARVLERLRLASGTDFGAYKKTTLRRRIARRMAVIRIETLSEYADRVEADPAEADALYEDCLISVTSFFRDPEVFQALADQVFPALLVNRSTDSPIRIWVAGCATGEEAYSIAIALLERAAELSVHPSIQIFATDLSERALTRAREGTYPVNIARDVSPERLRRFFAKVGEQYQISKSVREMCVFARHDLTRDPPYSRIDLVSCRNVLIYLEPSLQETVFATCHYALRPDGFMLVGPAETAGASPMLFATVDDKHRIFSRKPTTGPPRLLSARHNASPAWGASERAPSRATGASEVPREADRMLLARFGPAGVLVDEGLSVLEFRGDTDPFLDHGHGKASLNLERLLRRGLLIDLREAIEDARRTDAPVRRSGLQVRYRDQLTSVSLEVIPIKGRAASERCLLVLFEDENRGPKKDAPEALPAVQVTSQDEREVTRLGHALVRTTEYVHTLVREHEASLEELQSTTEEALSANEELQSLNEELQTAKEEIQSANEELATLNQELHDRNSQLARSNDEIQRGLDAANALIETVPQPLVILDRELRVERANAAFHETFRTSPAQTSGRPLSELHDGQWGRAELLTALNAVLSSGTPPKGLELEIQFSELGLRTLSLNAARLQPQRDTPVRLLLSVEDRTEIKRAEQGREELLLLEHDARERAETADQLKDQFVATVSHELRGPLTVISGWMNVLQADKNPDPTTLAKALAAIQRGVTAQGRLISDLLDHSRIVTGKVEIQLGPVDLLTTAEAALVGVRAAAEAKEISISLSGDHTTSLVLGDSDRMQQVLWNLFLNAIKFTAQGGSVRVSIERVRHEVHVNVTDTGCGIDAEFLPHVFERFRQAEGSSNRKQQGLGLGLTLVRELVELQGGTVRAASAGKDQGSTFTVVLPVPALLTTAHGPALNGEPELEQTTSSWPAPNDPQDPPTSPPRSMPARNTLHGTKILVVDDEADARDAIVNLLERYGAKVLPAASVSEALCALESDLPDILISDIGMPGQDGYDLIRHIRQLPQDAGGRLPSVALSAYTTDEHRDKVLKTGFQKHLGKPVAPYELVTEVARLVGRPALLS